MKQFISTIRAFNRAYLPAFDLLGQHYLGDKYNLTEVRVLFEIHEQAGCSAIDICKTLGLDKGYISRILKQFQEEGYIRKEPSSRDRRQQVLFLTDSGRTVIDSYTQKANEHIGRQLARLSPEQLAQFQQAIAILLPIIKEMEKTDENGYL